MTLKEIKEKLPTFPEGERAAVIRRLFEDHFCELSKQTLLTFQKTWAVINQNRNQKALLKFVAEQNKVVQDCIDYEVSQVGKIIREAFKLAPLTLDTDIEIYSTQEDEKKDIPAITPSFKGS
jgi:hypothetical protein